MPSTRKKKTKQPVKRKKIMVKIVQLKMVKEDVVEYKNSIRKSKDVVDMVRPLFKDSYREMVLVLGLNNMNLPNVIHTVGCGSPSQSPVFPANVFKPLLLSNSTSFILVHNHPASHLRPSNCDKRITNKLKEVGKILDITMIDHIILNSDCSDFYSFQTDGLL